MMTHLRALTSALLIACLALSGCGAVQRTTAYSATGSADPAGDSKIKAQFEAARDAPLPKEAEAVSVLIDTVPEGISLNDGVLAVEDGYQHRILGKFTISPKGGLFPDYKTGWRKGFCHPQQILVLATLFMWVLVPTYYPCFVDPTISKLEMVSAIKRVAYEAGGDLVIATYVGDTQEVAATAVGFIIQQDPRAAGGLGISGLSEEADDEAEPSEADAPENAAGSDALDGPPPTGSEKKAPKK